MPTSQKLAGLLLLLAAAAVPAGAASIINGSFEVGSDPGAGLMPLSPGSTTVAGWTIGGSGVVYAGEFWTASEGNRSIGIPGSPAGGLSQALATEVGAEYTLIFDMSADPAAGSDTVSTIVSIGGLMPMTAAYEVSGANTPGNMLWQTYSYTFTAVSTASALTFTGSGLSPYSAVIDNVLLLESDGMPSAIPEPASWTLMIAGFAMVGFSARSRRRHSSASMD